MIKQYYLRINQDNSFGFVEDGTHIIKASDKAITIGERDIFLDLQNNEGKYFRLKEKPTGTGLFDYIEEYAPDLIIDNTPTLEDRLKALEMAMLEVL